MNIHPLKIKGFQTKLAFTVCFFPLRLRSRLLALLSIHKRSDVDADKKQQAMLSNTIQLAS